MNQEIKHRGYLDDLSEEQRALVGRLKDELSGELAAHKEISTTWHLLRFLRARDFNFEKAKLMLKEFLDFRTKKDFKRIANIDQSGSRARLMRDNYTSGHYGTDYEGRIILIERVGGYNPDGLFAHFTLEDIEDHLIQIHERLMFVEMPIASQVAHRRIDNTFLIIDLKNVNVVQLFQSKLKSFVKFGAKIGQDYYPEILAKSVFINAPLIFKAIWSVISMWMDKRTVAKFHFESGNGFKTLSKYLNTDLLPAEIGGKGLARLTDGYGPWTEALRKSYANGTFFLEDRRPEYDYYYTPEEKRALAVQDKAHAQNTPEGKRLSTTRASLSSRSLLTNSQSFDDDILTPFPSIQEIRVSGFRVSLSRLATR